MKGACEISKATKLTEKRPYIVRRIWTTQGRYILSFPGVSQDAKLYPCDGIRGCERLPKTTGSFPLDASLVVLPIYGRNHLFKDTRYNGINGGYPFPDTFWVKVSNDSEAHGTNLAQGSL